MSQITHRIISETDYTYRIYTYRGKTYRVELSARFADEVLIDYRARVIDDRAAKYKEYFPTKEAALESAVDIIKFISTVLLNISKSKSKS